MKKGKIILLFIVLISGIRMNAQWNRNYETNPDRKRTNVWSFGNLSLIDFNVYPPQSKSGGRMESVEGVACISDTAGNLLFYTNGITVWNKNHEIVENGFELYSQLSSTQSSIILKHPENDSIYNITTAPFDYSLGFRINFINAKLNNGLGKLVLKNFILHPTSTEKQTAVNHQNNKDIWVIGHSITKNNFFAYLINKNGFISCPIQSSTGSILDISGVFKGNNQCYLKVSHNSNYLANCIPYDKKVELFNFSNLTGKISLFKTINLNFIPYGLEYSSNDSNLFISGFMGDTSYVAVVSINNGLTRVIKKYKLGQIQSLQMMNGIIYLASNDSNNIKAIDNINDFYLADFNTSKDISLKFPQRSTYGLPNFNQSYFYTPSIDFAYNYDCTSNSISFEGRDTFYADAHLWRIGKIGKPLEATYNNKNIIHAFKDTGQYQVNYIATKNLRSDTVIKTINIYPKVKKDFLGRDTGYETGISFTKTLKAPMGMHCYFWQNDSSSSVTFTTDTPGTFICKISSPSFCVVTDTIVIAECINDLVAPIIQRSSDTLYVNHSTADSFVWFRNGEFYKVAKTPFLQLTDIGTYRVEAAKKGHCNKSSVTQVVNQLGIKGIERLSSLIKIYPNPASNVLNLEFQQEGTFDIKIYDVLGQLIHQQTTESRTQIDIKNLPVGVYLIQINDTNNQQLNLKFLKE